jgi:D-alanyl-D-alanine carboxypeptidase/VanZ family protein
MVHLFDTSAYIPFGFTASMIFLVIHEIGLRYRNEQASWFHRIMILLFGLYLTAVFALTVSPVYGFSISHFGNSINLIPLKVLDTIADNPMNLWGNILLFVPVGVLLVLSSYKCQKIYVTVFSGAGLSFLIEVLQLFSTRGTDIDDIILNTVGTLCGYLLGRMILYSLPSLRKRVGVMILVENKYYRKKNDTGSIAALAAFVLIIVFVAGSSIKSADIKEPIISFVNKQGTPLQPDKTNISIFEDINAKNAYLLNVTSNTVLYEKESYQRIAPASTAKMLTALTVLEYCDENDEVLVGKEIERIAKDASRAWLYTGTRLTVLQLLDALLLPSGNDAAYALAVFTGRKISNDKTISEDKSIAAFMTAMNNKAVDIGAVHSHFVTPDGYDADGQYTTAYDLTCIAKAFMESSILKEIAGCYRISDVWLNGQEVTYYNTNELINPESPYFYECAAGLKTGNSEFAGSCLVSCAYIDNELYICVVMGSTEQGRWLDSLALYHAIR